MRYGTIIQYFADKGYGFIRPDVGPHIFFHITALGGCEPPPTIKLGQPVKFELMSTEELQARTGARRGGEESSAHTPPQRAQAKRVELIDRIPGGSLEDVASRQQPRRHPRARRTKPTWKK